MGSPLSTCPLAKIVIHGRGIEGEGAAHASSLGVLLCFLQMPLATFP
jgi:hypothetical protein